MIAIAAAKKIALSFPGAEEHEHWGRPAFSVKKKIFATLWPVEKRAVLKLSPSDQYVYTQMDSTIFFPVAGGWGRQGATFVDLTKINKALLKEALAVAWQGVAPKSLTEAYVKNK